MVLTFAYVTLLLEKGFDFSYVILWLEATKHVFKSPKVALVSWELLIW